MDILTAFNLCDTLYYIIPTPGRRIKETRVLFYLVSMPHLLPNSANLQRFHTYMTSPKKGSRYVNLSLAQNIAH